MPRTGADDNPSGADPTGTMAEVGTPRPGANAPGGIIPRPPNGPLDPGFFSGGGLTTVKDTTHSPRNNTNPNARFSSPELSAVPAPATFALDFTLRNSSVSARTKFICVSNAMNLPTKVRPSSNVTRIRQFTNCSMRLFFDTDMMDRSPKNLRVTNRPNSTSSTNHLGRDEFGKPMIPRETKLLISKTYEGKQN